MPFKEAIMEIQKKDGFHEISIDHVMKYENLCIDLRKISL
jgi:hypothetical protein